MHRLVLCLVFLWCSAPALGCLAPDFNFTLTGDGYYKLEHGDPGDWKVNINTTTTNSSDLVISVTITAPGKGPGCELGTSGKHYKIHSDKKSWRDALHACAEEGAHLLVINSQQEADHVNSLIDKAGTRKWVHWVGIHDFFQEGDYMTVFNEKLDYVQWAPGEPGGGTSLNCGFFQFTNSSDFGLADGNCKQPYRFICERDGPAPGYEPVTTLDSCRSGICEADVGNTSVANLTKPADNCTDETCQKDKPAPNNTSNPGIESGASLNTSTVVNKSTTTAKPEVSTPSPINESGTIENKTSEGIKPQSPMFGYEFLPGFGYYKVHGINSKKTWQEAQGACSEEGAHLVIFNSRREMAAVNTLVDKANTRSRLHWVGFDDQPKEGRYRTVCNDILRTSSNLWYPGRPDRSRTLNCGYYLYHNSSHHGLGDGNCAWPAPFICEEERTDQKSPPISTSDYRKIRNLGYYKVHKERSTWQKAQQACQLEGANLVVINSDDEAKFMVGLAGKGIHWVGVHDQFSEGRFVTVFNETLRTTGYVTWYPGEPNNVEWTEEDCVAFIYESSTRKGLADLYCSYDGPFICEYPWRRCPKT